MTIATDIDDLHVKVERVRKQQLKEIADARAYLCMKIADASFLTNDERRDLRVWANADFALLEEADNDNS